MQEDVLKNELNKITLSIKWNANPYLFVVSDDIDIRNYFIENISNLETVSVVDDSKRDDIAFVEAIKDNNILLLNSNMRCNQEKKEMGLPESHNALYYRLVMNREFLWKIKKTLIIVCDEETVIPLLNDNQSLASVSNFYFIDDYIKEIEKQKKLIK